MERFIGIAHLVQLMKGLESVLEKKADGMTAGILRGKKKRKLCKEGKRGGKGSSCLGNMGALGEGQDIQKSNHTL